MSTNSVQRYSLPSIWTSEPGAAEKDREIAYEESREAITHDPITSLPFSKPLIDPCGHTYDEETIKGFKALGANIVECPVSRRPVGIDQFVPNLYAENAISYMSESERRSASSSTPTPSGTGMDHLVGLMGLVLERLEDLTIDQRIMYRQISNLASMSYCDRIVSLVKCNHFNTVRDRGLTEKEKRRVNWYDNG